MMLDSLKPTPVSVTTPMMMPTVAAAAPTLMAYLAPTTKASTMSRRRALPASSCSTYQADTAMEAAKIGMSPTHSVRISSRTQSAISRKEGDRDNADCDWSGR